MAAEDDDACRGKAEVIIGKQRHGPVGTVELSFESQFTRFGNLAREYQLPERVAERAATVMHRRSVGVVRRALTRTHRRRHQRACRPAPRTGVVTVDLDR